MTPLLPLCIVLAYALGWGILRRVGDVAHSAEKLAVSGLRSKLEMLRAERSKLEAVKQDAIRQADEAIAAKSEEVSELEDLIAKAG